MAKSSITNITTAQTFQNWFDKTNEIVDIFRDEALTASPGGDSTTGNATLVGDFTATNLVGTTAIKSDLFQPYNSGQTMIFDGEVEFTDGNQVVATFKSVADGPQIEFTDNTITWNMGFEDSSAAFIIDTGVGTTRFKLNTAGTLTVPNIDTTEGIDIGSDLEVGGDSRFIGVSEFDGDVTINGSLDIGGADLVVGGLTANTITAALDITTAQDMYCRNLRASGEVVTDYSASDITLKQNIERIEDPLEKVRALGGYTFEYKDKPGERATGVIAQEVEMVLPGLVYETDHPTRGEHKAVRYGHIVALLIEAVKELQEEVQRLKDGSSD